MLYFIFILQLDVIESHDSIMRVSLRTHLDIAPKLLTKQCDIITDSCQRFANLTTFMSHFRAVIMWSLSESSFSTVTINVSQKPYFRF